MFGLMGLVVDGALPCIVSPVIGFVVYDDWRDVFQ